VSVDAPIDTLAGLNAAAPPPGRRPDFRVRRRALQSAKEPRRALRTSVIGGVALDLRTAGRDPQKGLAVPRATCRFRGIARGGTDGLDAGLGILLLRDFAVLHERNVS